MFGIEKFDGKTITAKNLMLSEMKHSIYVEALEIVLIYKVITSDQEVMQWLLTGWSYGKSVFQLETNSID